MSSINSPTESGIFSRMHLPKPFRQKVFETSLCRKNPIGNFQNPKSYNCLIRFWVLKVSDRIFPAKEKNPGFLQKAFRGPQGSVGELIDDNFMELFPKKVSLGIYILDTLSSNVS